MYMVLFVLIILTMPFTSATTSAENLSPAEMENAITISDNMTTAVVISHPSDGATINGTVEIVGTAYGRNITSVEVRIDNGNWQQAVISYTSSSPTSNTQRLDFDYALSWDTRTVSNGEHLISVKAVGDSGTNDTTINVLIDNSDSENALSGSWFLLWGGVISALFVVMLLIIYTMRKKKEK